MLDVKSIEADKRVFRGIATTPTLDRVSDRINPMKATFAPEIPLLHAHNHQAPIGVVRLGKPTKNGIPFEAEIPVINEPPTLKERVDVAWGEIVHGLVRAVSIGFRATEAPEFNKDGGLDFNGVEIMETSTVAIPAQSEAIISAVKSIDQQVRRDAGVEDDPLPEIPAQPKDEAATGKSVRVVKLAPARDRAPFVVREIKRT
jgi:hypothetical protein